MLVPISKQKTALIVNSIKRVFEKNDINLLTKTAYDYLYLASGFIAHTNLYGFRDTYSNVSNLREDILANQFNNMWNNFIPGEPNFEYYMSKKAVYIEIVKVAKNRS